MSKQAHDFDNLRLAEYLQQHVAGFRGPLSASKFPGGQSNPTFAITADSGKYVLRRKPPGELLKSAHAVDREFRVLRALADTEVPVARAYHLCEDESIIGSMFYLMEFVEGEVYWNPALPELDLPARNRIYDEMNRVLAALHSVDIKAAGLSDYGKPGNYFERQINRWTRQYRASETDSIAAMEALMKWLPDNLPKDDGKVSLVHGDYRLDNLMFHPQQHHVLAVVDWELSTLGHPYADLAYQCMQWHLPAGDHNNGLSGLAGLDCKALGIPTEEEYVASYCRRMGLEAIDNWHFYLAFCFFRLAAIIQGVRKRALDGNASSDKAQQIGTLVVPVSELGLGLIS